MTEKEQKDQLEAYARERFGVDLDKRKKLETLQEQVERLEQQLEDCEALTSHPPTVSEEVNKRIDELSTVLVVDDVHSGIQAIGVDENDAMNALALRIWQGQSISLPLKMRVQRIASALRDKGFDDLSGLVLPTNENIKRFL